MATQMNISHADLELIARCTIGGKVELRQASKRRFSLCAVEENFAGSEYAVRSHLAYGSKSQIEQLIARGAERVRRGLVATKHATGIVVIL